MAAAFPDFLKSFHANEGVVAVLRKVTSAFVRIISVSEFSVNLSLLPYRCNQRRLKAPLKY
jgi:hypothetical protein